jgi:hypothetical protein
MLSRTVSSSFILLPSSFDICSPSLQL